MYIFLVLIQSMTAVAVLWTFTLLCFYITFNTYLSVSMRCQLSHIIFMMILVTGFMLLVSCLIILLF